MDQPQRTDDGFSSGVYYERSKNGGKKEAWACKVPENAHMGEEIRVDMSATEEDDVKYKG